MNEQELKALGKKVVVRGMAEQHSKFVKELLMRELENKIKLYEDAFIHGYKHGKDSD